jgi:hypothetical protein
VAAVDLLCAYTSLEILMATSRLSVSPVALSPIDLLFEVFFRISITR